MCNNEHNSTRNYSSLGMIFLPLDMNSKSLIISLIISTVALGLDLMFWQSVVRRQISKPAESNHNFNQHNGVLIRNSKIWIFSTGTWRRSGCCSRDFSSCLTRRCWRSWDRPRTRTPSRRTSSPCSTTSRRSNSTRNSTRSSSLWRHPRERPLMWVPTFLGVSNSFQEHTGNLHLWPLLRTAFCVFRKGIRQSVGRET